MFKKFAIVAAAMSLSACATYVATPYDRSTANVQEIAMVDDALPEKVVAWEIASTGSSFGLIGGLVDLAIQQSRTDAVNAALTSIDYDAETILERRLAESLSTEGYQVEVLQTGPRPKREMLKSYANAPEATDAYLDVMVLEYGYLSPGAGQPFRPYVFATVKLVSAADPSVVLGENRIIYNPFGTPKGVITITPNLEYSFRNRDELLADPEHLAAGITDALNQVADTSARLFH